MMKDRMRQYNPAYLLPNAFTTGNLLGGFLAIVFAQQGKFSLAAITLFVAMLLDAMDGRIARLTHTQSAFGEQYDSMSDMVSFGIAPGFLAYAFTLHYLGRWGMFAGFVFAACAAIRLARFNTNIDVVDSSFFQGLPSPSAAAIVASFVLFMNGLGVDAANGGLQWVSFVIVVYAGVSMVTNVMYPSGKKSSGQKKLHPALLVAIPVILLGLVLLNPPLVIFVIMLLYSLSGWVLMLLRYKRRQKKSVGTPKDM